MFSLTTAERLLVLVIKYLCNYPKDRQAEKCVKLSTYIPTFLPRDDT